MDFESLLFFESSLLPCGFDPLPQQELWDSLVQWNVVRVPVPSPRALPALQLLVNAFTAHFWKQKSYFKEETDTLWL